MERLSYLAFAAAYARVGIVYVVGDELRYWKMSCKAACDIDSAASVAQAMIDRWQPDVVITECIDKLVHKSAMSKAITLAMARVAEDCPKLDMTVERRHAFKNKSEEARHLIEKYPPLRAVNYKSRRFFDPEPRSTVIFEALSLIESVKRGPTPQLAAALG